MLSLKLASMGTAVRQLQAYRQVARWLAGLATRFAAMPLALAPVFGLLGLALQVLPLLIAVKLLGNFELGSGAKPVALPGGLLLTPAVGVLAIIAMLLASAGFRYISHIIAIGAEKRVNTGLSQQILSDFNSLDGPYARWSLEYLVDSDDLRRSVSSGTRFCGMVIRLALVNAVNVFYLVAGIAMLIWLAPVVFLIVVPVFLLAAALAYPLNQRALELGRKFEAVGGERGAALRSRLRYAVIDQDDAIDGDGLDGDVAQVESAFLDLLESRLKLLELVHLVYAVLFAMLVGVLLWLLVSGYAAHLLDYSVLVILFFAIRFSFNGLRSVIVFLTTVNRHLPAIIRTHRLVGAIEHTRAEKQAQAAVGLNDSGWPAAPAFPWTVATDGEEPRSGSFRKGHSYYFVLPHATTNSLIRHLLTIVRRDHALAARLAEQALTSDQTIDLVSPPAGMIEWIERMLAEGELIVTQTAIERALATAKLGSGSSARHDTYLLTPPNEAKSADSVLDARAAEHGAHAEAEAISPQIISAILAVAHVFRRTRSRNPMIILNDGRVARLPMATKLAIAAEFASHIVIYAMPLPPTPEGLSIAEYVFSGPGDRFEHALPTADLGPEDWAALGFVQQEAAEAGQTSGFVYVEQYAEGEQIAGMTGDRMEDDLPGQIDRLLPEELPTPRAIGLGDTIKWGIFPEFSIPRHGKLAPGDVVVVALPPRSSPLSEQFTAICGQHGEGSRRAFESAIIRAQALLSGEEIDTWTYDAISSEELEQARWVGSIMRDCGIHATDEDCAAIIAGVRADDQLWPAVIRYLGSIHLHLRTRNPFVILDKRLFLHLSPEWQRVIYARLSERIVIYSVRWIDKFTPDLPVKWFFSSTGMRIAFGNKVADMGLREWKLARLCYGSDRHRGTQVEWNTDIQDNEAG